MPVSTSSNTSVGTRVRVAATTSIARLIRESSPPEATRSSGRALWPGLAAMRNSISSVPAALTRAWASGVTRTLNTPSGMPSDWMMRVIASPR